MEVVGKVFDESNVYALKLGEDPGKLNVNKPLMIFLAKFYQSIFHSSTMALWNNLEQDTHCSMSYGVLKKYLCPNILFSKCLVIIT